MKLSRKQLVLFFFLIIASFVGCISKKEKEATAYTITVNPSSNESALLSSIIDEIEIIPLETKENNYVSEIDKIRFHNGKFYLFEKFGSQKLLCFDENGKFLYQIGSIGKAVGEYITPRDFNINTWTNRIELYDILSNKILYYNLDGSYMGKFAVDRKLRAYTIIDSLHYGCFNDGEYKDLPYNFFVTSSKTFTVEKVCIPFLGERDIMNGINPFYEGDNGVIFAYSLNDTIYSITAKGARPKYIVDYKNERLSPNILNKSMQEIVTNLLGKRVPGFISRLVDTDSVLTFSYSYDSLKNNTVFYHKLNGRTTNVYKPINDFNYITFQPPVCAMGSKLVSIVPAYEILQLYYDLTKIKQANSVNLNIRAYDELKRIVSALRENDNPVLMVYKLKHN